jgi:hypothetical protein
MKKVFILLLFSSWIIGIANAQVQRDEFSVSWLPVTLDDGDYLGFQLSYFRELRPWYYIGAAVFRFGSKDEYSYSYGRNAYGDSSYGLNLLHRFTTPESLRLGAFAQIGISIYAHRYFDESVTLSTDPNLPPTSFRFDYEGKVGGNVWTLGVFVKPTKQFKLSTGINLYSSWVRVDPNVTYVEFSSVSGCFDVTAAWRF